MVRAKRLPPKAEAPKAEAPKAEAANKGEITGEITGGSSGADSSGGNGGSSSRDGGAAGARRAAAEAMGAPVEVAVKSFNKAKCAKSKEQNEAMREEIAVLQARAPPPRVGPFGE